MRIEQLQYIAAVTRLGSLRRAAEQLHVSQPALSETVRNLEAELGVTLLERHRSGARISADGRELLPHIVDILEAVDRLKAAADEAHRSSRMIRVGTVNAATVPLLIPALRDFRAAHPQTQVEVVDAQQASIHQSLLDGVLDLGLVNLLEGDDIPPDLTGIELILGRPVVCLRADDPLAAGTAVGVEELRAAPLIAMRAGYVIPGTSTGSSRATHRCSPTRPTAPRWENSWSRRGSDSPCCPTTASSTIRWNAAA